MSATRGRVCARTITHAVVLAGVLLALGATQAVAAPPPADFYGVNAGGTLTEIPLGRTTAFERMRAGGLSYARVDAAWNHIEPAPPIAGVRTYVWTTYDLLVADLARSGLRWYPMLGYSTPWASSASGDIFAPPSGDTDFSAFASAVAQRYGAGGSFWSAHPELPKLPTTVYGIWNEPSNPHFWRGPTATPARYMSLYLAARAAIKSVDPAGRVATAGLLDSGMVDGTAYLRAMLDSAPGTRNQIDALGWHPYVGGLEEAFASIGRARATLSQYGLTGVPIEISEIGWHTGFDASQRAEWMRGLAAWLPHAGLNVTRLMPYVWASSPDWQMTNADGTLGQLGDAYFAGIRDAVSPQATRASQTVATTAPIATKKAKISKTTCKSTKKSKYASRRKAKATKKCLSKVSKKSSSKSKAKAAKARSAKISPA